MRFIFKTSYDQDIRLFKHSGQVLWYGLLVTLLLLAPLILDDFYLGELAFVFIYAIAGVGLMLLVGYTGLASLGHAAFLAIGAYAHAWLFAHHVPILLSLFLASLLSALVGVMVAIPALRMTNVYLAIATLAFSIVVEQIIIRWDSVTGGFRGMLVEPPVLFGHVLWLAWEFYYLCLALLMMVVLAALNLLRSPIGRAMIAIRDSEVSAQSLGVNLAWTKAIAFGLSAAFTGLAGGLFAHKFGYLAPDAFNFITSIQLLLMVVIGGLGSIHGAIYGALFIGLLPQILAILRDTLPPVVAQQPGLEPGLFGLILVLVIIFEPLGIYGRWVKIKLYFQMFPLYRQATFKRQKTFLKTERMH